jgi:hypothetical protein
MLVPQRAYPIEKAVLALLPAFVAAKIQEVARARGHVTFTYHTLDGSVESRDTGKRIVFLMHGRARHWIHQAGSKCWIVPSSLILHFETIAPEQLACTGDADTWWAVCSAEDDRQRSLHVYKVAVVAESEVLSEWEDM